MVMGVFLGVPVAALAFIGRVVFSRPGKRLADFGAWGMYLLSR
jgi:hypothetical protein